MAKVILSEDAQTDLREIWLYLSENSLNSADRVIDEMMRKFRMLAENPKVGQLHDELIINLRSFPYKKYIIFYFSMENGVEIYRIIHGARNIEDLFEDFFRGLES
ncbi:MAG TPA: type II toxin-antitoxin system RelE/ParE family toxin [Pyrinomonadaceae bacterium]|nr:type II toxin-antitoxin system RelE/ParE family toxin [Pyrinomonadaceae bacterium]